jgi:hypothetical protein
VAIRAPSESERSFTHMMLSCTRLAKGLCANPQSVPVYQIVFGE